MVREKLVAGLALVFWSMLLLAGHTGARANDNETFPVYNVTQHVYAGDLQAALDSARPGDYIQVINPFATFNHIDCQVDNLTIDLNGASIKVSDQANYAISVSAAVYRITIRDGNLTRGIEIKGDTSSQPLELQLVDMVINGGTSIQFQRNGRLECSGGKLAGTGYGVMVDSVKDFNGVFTGVTFTRSQYGAIYFSSPKKDNPVVRISLAGCRVGENNNSPVGTGLKVEAGRAEIDIKNCTFAGASRGKLVHVDAGGTVSISDSWLYSQEKTAVYALGVDSLTLARNQVTVINGWEYKYPAVEAVSCSAILLEDNTLTGPGNTSGVEIDDGRVTLQGNVLRNFATGIVLGNSQATNLYVEAEENLIDVHGTAMLVAGARSGVLRGNDLKGNTALNVQASQGMQAIENTLRGLQGPATSLQISKSQGITASGNIFKYNMTGISIRDSTDVTITGSSLSPDAPGGVPASPSTGILISGSFSGELRDNTFKANTTGVDLIDVSAPRLVFKENSIYNNGIGFKAPPGENLDVSYNYWGSSSGPRHNLNPGGYGDVIEGNPGFIPWAPNAFFSDARPPEVVLTLPAATWLTNDVVSFQVSLAEETWLDRVILRVYGPGDAISMEKTWWREEWPPEGVSLTWDPGGMADGSYRFNVVAVDGKGNKGQAVRYLFLDRRGPGAGPGGRDTGDEPPEGYPSDGSNEPTGPDPGADDDPAHQDTGNGSDGEETDPGSPPGNIPGEGNGDSWETPGNDSGQHDKEHPREGVPLNKGGGDSFKPPLVKDDFTGEFLDVPPGHWAGEAILAMARAGLLAGDSRGRFHPQAPLTKAELAVILNMVLAIPEDPEIPRRQWTDVAPGSRYAGAIERVTGAGIMQGDTGGIFHPLAGISREQAVLILARAREWQRRLWPSAPPKELSRDILLPFSDGNDVSQPARGAVIWAVNNSLLRGYPDGTLRPRATLTRAEAAVLIKRFLELLNYDGKTL